MSQNALRSIQTETRMDSRVLAKHLGLKRKNTFELIKRYLGDFTAFGALWIENEKPIKGAGGGRPEKYALLNKLQTTLLLAYSKNTQQARALKIRLIKDPSLFVSRLAEELA